MNIPQIVTPKIKGNYFMGVVVLFSGGRDSSLTACLFLKDGVIVHLLTCNDGTLIDHQISTYRFDEIKAAFPLINITRTTVSTYGLFRRIALVDIESDFLKFKKNLIFLGSQLATHTEGILYCLNHNIDVLASGFTNYESNLAEQMPETIPILTSFIAEYGIKYTTPIYGYGSEDEVKYRLLDFGISTKSLEGVSIFADTFSDPTPEVVSEYIKAKLPICRDYISFKSALTPKI
jgi:hypothetical protein